ncbi:MAG: hypothetical protein M1826_005689 [Phylliscum demangeonii]|nr:MAG: hypothetical protein M1826_005689 [Phylliscum demangeonii]
MSWAGWAISSFTNKISSARGEMQPSAIAKPATPPAIDAQPGLPRSIRDPSRPSSRIPSASPLRRHAAPHAPSKPATAATRQLPTNKSSASAAVSPAPDYFDYEDPAQVDEEMNAWAAMGDEDYEDAPSSSAAQSNDHNKEDEAEAVIHANKSFVAYDDSGEPDFAGWLAAQSAQSKAQRALPKGLAKKSDTNANQATTGGGGGAAAAANSNPTGTTRGGRAVSTGPSISGSMPTAKAKPPVAAAATSTRTTTRAVRTSDPQAKSNSGWGDEEAGGDDEDDGWAAGWD